MHVLLIEQRPEHTRGWLSKLQQSRSFTFQRTNLPALLGKTEVPFALESDFPQVLLLCEAEHESDAFWNEIQTLQQRFPHWPLLTYVEHWNPQRAFAHIARGAQECLSLQHSSLEQLRYVFSCAWIRHRDKAILLLEKENNRKLDLSYRSLFETSSDVIFISTPSGQLLDINQAGIELFGFTTKEELLSSNMEELYINPVQRERIQSQLEKHGSVKNMELTLKHRDGKVLFVSESATVVRDESGKVIAYRGILRDMTEVRHQQQALRKREERYAAAMAGAQDGLWDWDLLTQRFYFSKRWKEIAGWTDEKEPGSLEDWFLHVHEEDKAHLKEAMQAHLKGQNEHLEVEYRILLSDQSVRWVLARGMLFRNEFNLPVRMAGAIRDITIQKRRELRLRFSASHDILTSLPNRALFVERLEQAFERFRLDDSRKFAVLFLDLDGFKSVNDSFGHPVGDRLLIAIAGRVQNCLRTEDLAARFGGDEFAVLLEDVDSLEGAVRVSERILKALQNPFRIDSREIKTNASIGIAMSHHSYLQAEEMLRRADSSMYRAKREGKGRFCIVDFNQNMQATVQRIDWVQRSFPEALEKGHLKLEWEPICNLADGQPAGAELVPYWSHETQGRLHRDDFLPLLVEAGLSVAWNKWYFDELYRLLFQTSDSKRWKRIHLTLSNQSLTHGSVIRQLSRAQLDLSRFVLNLSARQYSEHRHFRGTLEELEAMGVRFCLSDYGQGLLSLQELHALPLSFVQTHPELVQTRQWEVLRSLQALTKALPAELIIEGINTEKALEELKELGYQWGKGTCFP